MYHIILCFLLALGLIAVGFLYGSSSTFGNSELLHALIELVFSLAEPLFFTLLGVGISLYHVCRYEVEEAKRAFLKKGVDELVNKIQSMEYNSQESFNDYLESNAFEELAKKALENKRLKILASSHGYKNLSDTMNKLLKFISDLKNNRYDKNQSPKKIANEFTVLHDNLLGARTNFLPSIKGVKFMLYE